MAKQYREGHIPIPGWVYIIIGAIVAIYAKIVQASDPENGAMTLFFYIGIVIVVIGIGKLLLKKEKKVEDVTIKREAQRYEQQLQQQHQQMQHQQRRAAQQPAQHNVIRCRCGAVNWSSSSFCHKCGAALR